MRILLMCTVSAAMLMNLVFLTGTGQAGKCELADFNAANFNPPEENEPNPYLGFGRIGWTYVYKAETEEGSVTNYIGFTTATKDILGVTCIVVRDIEYIEIEDVDASPIKLEATDDWYAWDKDGNFWYFGEETIEYLFDDDWNPDGTSTEGSWEAGVDGAEPGIILLADPQPGDCVQQEFYEDIAEDRGKVLRLNGDESDHCQKNCLVTKEWTPLDPGNIEHKYYAPDIGLVYIKELKGKNVVYELKIEEIYPGTPPEDLAPLHIAPN